MTSLIGKIDARQYFKQSGLPGAISSDDPEELPLLDLKANVVQGPLILPLIPHTELHQAFPQRSAAFLWQAEGLGEITNCDGGRHTSWKKKDEG